MTAASSFQVTDRKAWMSPRVAGRHSSCLGTSAGTARATATHGIPASDRRGRLPPPVRWTIRSWHRDELHEHMLSAYNSNEAGCSQPNRSGSFARARGRWIGPVGALAPAAMPDEDPPP